MNKQVSQRDLAKIAKVSPMTVSLALRDHPSISLITRRRIKQLAKDRNYRPDPALAALNAYRLNQRSTRYQGVIGWLTSFPTKAGWRAMIQATGYFSGACVRAEELGYGLEEIWCAEPGINSRRLTQMLTARNIRGLIVAPLPNPKGELTIEWRHFSAVSLGYSLLKPQLHVVMNHQFRNMKHLVMKLQEKGYTRIGFAMPSSNDNRVDHNYIGGYIIAQREFPRSVTRLAPLLVDLLNKEVLKKWILRARPDVVVVAASQAYEIIEWLKELDIRVPSDIGIAVASIPYQDKFISGIDENVPSIGAHAVDSVVGMIHRNEQGIPKRPGSLLLEGVWSDGRTVR